MVALQAAPDAAPLRGDSRSSDRPEPVELAEPAAKAPAPAQPVEASTNVQSPAQAHARAAKEAIASAALQRAQDRHKRGVSISDADVLTKKA